MDWKSADHILFGSDVAVLAETGAFWTENWDERLVDFAQGSHHCSPTDARRPSLEDGAESSAHDMRVLALGATKIEKSK